MKYRQISEGCAFVKLASSEAAQAAIASLHGSQTMPVSFFFAKFQNIFWMLLIFDDDQANPQGASSSLVVKLADTEKERQVEQILCLKSWRRRRATAECCIRNRRCGECSRWPATWGSSIPLFSTSFLYQADTARTARWLKRFGQKLKPVNFSTRTCLDSSPLFCPPANLLSSPLKPLVRSGRL